MVLYEEIYTMGTIEKILKSIFGFKGRINRMRYLVALPIIITGEIVKFSLAMIFISVVSDYYNGYNHIFMNSIMGYPLSVCIIIFFVFKYSHISRRIQDFNKSISESWLGWLEVISDIFFAIGLIQVNNGLASPLGVLSITFGIGSLFITFGAGLGIIILIRLVFIKGNDEDNKYGSKPKPFGKMV